MSICPSCKKESITLHMGFSFGKYMCKSCGYIGPFIIEKDSKKKINHKKVASVNFFNKIAHQYDHFLIGWWLRYVQRDTIKHMILGKKIRVLDIGCGTGYFLGQLAKKLPHSDLFGIDFSSAMIKKAKMKMKNRSNVELVVGDAEKMPFKKKFDYIVTTEAFHHFTNPKKIISEMKRLLKKDGKIIIVDLFLPPLFLWRILFKLEPGFVQMYSKKDMRKLLTKSGLKVLKQKRVGIGTLLTIASF